MYIYIYIRTYFFFRCFLARKPPAEAIFLDDFCLTEAIYSFGGGTGKSLKDMEGVFAGLGKSSTKIRINTIQLNNEWFLKKCSFLVLNGSPPI